MANVLKIWWATKFLTRNLMDSSYISHFRDSTPSFFLHSYLNYIELLSILRQKYNPVMTKTDIGGEKNEEGRWNWKWNTICILSGKEIASWWDRKEEKEIHYRIPRIVDRGYVKQYLKIMIFEYQHCLLQNYCVILHTIKLGSQLSQMGKLKNLKKLEKLKPYALQLNIQPKRLLAITSNDRREW